MTHTLVLLRHGESDVERREPLHRLGRRTPQRQGPRRGRARRPAAEGRRPRPRRRAHLAAAPGDHHRGDLARRGRPALDPGPPVVAAQRAPLRRAAGQEQEADPGGVRRGAVHALAPLVRRAPAADRRRRPSGPRPGCRSTPTSATRCPAPSASRTSSPGSCRTGSPHRPRPARRQDRAGRRPRQQPARAGQAPRRISDEDIAGLNIPTGMPLVYELDDDAAAHRRRAAATSTPTRPPRPPPPWRTRVAERSADSSRASQGVERARDRRLDRDGRADDAASGVDGGRVLAGDDEDDPVGDRDGVVGDPLVVAAEQGDVDGGLDAVRPVVGEQLGEAAGDAAGPSPRRPGGPRGRRRRRGR